MSLPNALKGDRWTEKTARAILPLLVQLAQRRQTITYGRLDLEIQDRGWGHHVHHAKYGWPAGAVGDAIAEMEQDWGKPIPPINALIVNGTTGLPSKGVDPYVERYVHEKYRKRKLTATERRSILENIVHPAIFDFDEWEELLRHMSLAPLAGKRGGKGRTVAPTRGGWSDEHESKYHKALRKYVAENPTVVGLPIGFRKGNLRHVFPSADKPDVMFDDGKTALAVEVKSRTSNEADLERGIYQSVKYKALLVAEQMATKRIPGGRAVLVVEAALPRRLRFLAELLRIPVVVHRL